MKGYLKVMCLLDSLRCCNLIAQSIPLPIYCNYVFSVCTLVMEPYGTMLGHFCVITVHHFFGRVFKIHIKYVHYREVPEASNTRSCHVCYLLFVDSRPDIVVNSYD